MATIARAPSPPTSTSHNDNSIQSRLLDVVQWYSKRLPLQLWNVIRDPPHPLRVIMLLKISEKVAPKISGATFFMPLVGTLSSHFAVVRDALAFIQDSIEFVQEVYALLEPFAPMALALVLCTAPLPELEIMLHQNDVVRALAVPTQHPRSGAVVVHRHTPPQPVISAAPTTIASPPSSPLTAPHAEPALKSQVATESPVVSPDRDFSRRDSEATKYAYEADGPPPSVVVPEPAPVAGVKRILQDSEVIEDEEDALEDVENYFASHLLPLERDANRALSDPCLTPTGLDVASRALPLAPSCAQLGGVPKKRMARLMRKVSIYLAGISASIEGTDYAGPADLVRKFHSLHGDFHLVHNYEISIVYDPMAARTCFEMAMRRRYSPALARLARSHLQPADVAQAAVYAERGTNAFSRDAMVLRSYLYRAGHAGMLVDLNQHAYWMHRAAKHATRDEPDGAFHWSLLLGDTRVEDGIVEPYLAQGSTRTDERQAYFDLALELGCHDAHVSKLSTEKQAPKAARTECERTGTMMSDIHGRLRSEAPV